MTATILVVDDIPANVKLLEARLTAEYFEVLSARSGEEALRACEGDQVDLVLLDIMMPGMDGLEVCRRLKENQATMHIPVVFVTALDQPSDRVEGLRAGADDFLTKPVNDLQLMARVKSLVRLKRLTDELRSRARTARDIGLEKLLSEQGGALIDKGKTLLVDARPGSCQRIESILNGTAELTIVSDPQSALFEAVEAPYELVVISTDLPDYDPLRLCSQLRSLERTRFIPLLLICKIGEEELVNRALDLGVNDYIVWPLEPNELIARCNTQFRRKRYNDRLRHDLEQTMELAITDPLTGLYNRRYLDNHIKLLLERCIGRVRPLSVLLLDIDRFKSVNDAFGHDVGDAVIREFARRIRQTTRGIDMACRYGGEEFVVVLPDTDLKTAEVVAERLRMQIVHAPFEIEGSLMQVSVTASIGISVLSGPQDTPELLIKRADTALFEAKRSGRNRVVVQMAA